MQPEGQDFLSRLAHGWRAWALIAALSVVAALPGIASIPVLDRDEARFAQASRQMIETRDLVRIQLQDEPRYKKPIGIHWLQAATVTLSGAPLNAIWAYRLASVLGGVLAALATFWAGLALFDRRTAFLGAALFAPGALMSAEAAIAKTDAVLCGCIALALAAAAHLRASAPKRPRAMALIFWGAFAAGVLTKGPVAPVVCGLTLAALALWERRIAWMAPLAHWSGPALAAAMVLPWAVAISVATQGAFFTEMLGGDLAPKIGGGQEGHGAWPGYHLLLLAPLLAPAVIGLGQAIAATAGLARTPPAERAALVFLICWIAPAFAFFELLPTKLAHYTLPTYPAFALLCAHGLMRGYEHGWRRAALASWIVFALAGAALVGVTAYAATMMPGDAAADQRRAMQAGMVGALALIVALVALSRTRTPLAKALIAIAFVLVSSWHLRGRILPEARDVQISAEVTRALRRADLLPRADGPPLAVIGFREASIVFETETRTMVWPGGDMEAFAARIPLGAPVVAPCAFASRHADGYAWRDDRIEGLNLGNGDRVCMRIGQRSDGPS